MNQTFESLVSALVSLINGTVIPLIFALGFVFFLAGIVRYFFIDESAQGKENGRQFAIAGLIGFVVLFGIWGIVSILLSAIFGISPGSTS